MDAIDRGAALQLDPVRCSSRRTVPRVGDRHMGTGLLERGRDRIGAVIVGRNDDALADQNIVPPEIG